MRRTPALIAAAIVTASVVVGGYLWATQALGSLPVIGTQSGSTGPRLSWRAPAPMMAAQPAPALGPALLHPATVTVNSPGFWSWSLLDRRTGEIVGSPNLGSTNVTASMIKAWLAADYLRRAAEKRQTPSAATLKRLTIMIRDSDNAAASFFSSALGGTASISRLVKICGLTDSRPNLNWANAKMSARDSARMGGCLADGRAAGPKWTEWVLGEMRAVRGVGRFGIIAALPPEEAKVTAMKNGWVVRSDGKWHVNCMAVGPEWSLAVMLVYPANRGFAHGAGICKSVAQQLMA
ncbi:MAG TPA: serine hydrolase [Micromonosporaceae bacterium]|nr:serine hydrolase [Micromonosporaceae bacterium]